MGRGTGADSRRLVLVTAVVLGVALFLFIRNTSSKQSTLEIHAEYRCAFDGLEILPGGEMSTSLEPGRYEIRVFNSAAPGGWESQFYTLHAGQSLLVACRPRRIKR